MAVGARKPTRSAAALFTLVLLLVSSTSATGLSVWKDAGDAFNSGELSQVEFTNGTVSLEMNRSLLDNWTIINPGNPPLAFYQYGNGESPLFSPNMMIYDEIDGVVVLYDYASLWSYNVSENSWSLLIHCGFYPHNGLAYVKSDNIIVFLSGDYFFSYKVGEDHFIQKTMSSPPSFVGGSTPMAYDDFSSRIVILGGNNGNETWAYDIKNDSWTALNPLVSPPIRNGCSMVFDRSAGEFVLYGGLSLNRTTILNDTWTFNLTKNIWTLKKPSISPPPMTEYAMVYDGGTGNVIITGGVTTVSPGHHTCNEVWWYDPASNIWMNKTQNKCPQPRAVQAAAYDSQRRLTILFGGHNETARFGDTWTYDSTKNNWTLKIPLVVPIGRQDHCMVADDRDGMVAIFGGTSSGHDDMVFGAKFYPQDIWLYNVTGDLWTNRQPMPAPPGRTRHAMVYDNDDNVIILFGGEQRNDTWAYNLSTNVWTNMNPQKSPCARYGPQMTYDRVRKIVMLFGGNDSVQSLGDTWQYDFATNNWTQIYSSPSPPPDDWHSMAYNEAEGLTLLASSVDNCLWAYNGDNNSWIKKASLPFKWQRHTYMDYDCNNAKMIISAYETYPPIYFYNLSMDKWTIGTWPDMMPNDGYAYSYDRTSDTIVLFGGFYGGGEAPSLSHEVWVHNLKRYGESGTITSKQFDTGAKAFFEKLQWDADLPQGTNIKFQLRTAYMQEWLNLTQFTGPDGTNYSFYNTSGQMINGKHNGTRWLQYRAYLSTSDDKLTPILRNVTVNYNLLHSLQLSSPKGDENWTATQNITWSASDKDNDSLTFDITLENATTIITLATNLTNGTGRWSWNTADIANGTYRIRITAKDDNPSIPLVVNATSNNFTIYHPPPPNRPPEITLLYPPSNAVVNSTSVRFRWNGTDPDGDILSYNLRISQDPPMYYVNYGTPDEYLDLFNLLDGRTYHWGVSVSDNRSAEPPLLSDIWSFTVHFPPVNKPIRITSTPPEIVWTGQEYSYNITTVDDDRDIPAYILLLGPPNMTLDRATGRLRWAPTTADIGNHTITIQASDGNGSTANQTFTIQVLETPVPPAIPPTCKIVTPANGSKVRGAILINGTAAIGRLPLASVFVSLDGSDWKIATGLDNWTFSINTSSLAKGKHVIQARAFDGGLYSENATVEIIVDRPNPKITTDQFPISVIAIVAVIATGLVTYLSYRKKSQKR